MHLFLIDDFTFSVRDSPNFTFQGFKRYTFPPICSDRCRVCDGGDRNPPLFEFNFVFFLAIFFDMFAFLSHLRLPTKISGSTPVIEYFVTHLLEDIHMIKTHLASQFSDTISRELKLQYFLLVHILKKSNVNVNLEKFEFKSKFRILTIINRKSCVPKIIV